MTLQPQRLSIGERSPFIVGAGANGLFYSLDGQAGRPAVLLLLGVLPQEQVIPLLQAFEAKKFLFSDLNTDVVALASIGNGSLAAYANANANANANAASLPIIFSASDDIFQLCAGHNDRAAVLVLDRSGRLVAVIDADDNESSVERSLQATSMFSRQAGRPINATAPLLIVPNLIDRQFCHELIQRFETGPHEAGVMASADTAGAGYAKLDTAKKKRRDLILDPKDALHARVVEVLASRLVPEIKRAFQFEVAHLDRILIARYDSGEYFRRHRDNAAAHVSYRQFALSLNLNTDEYEGGNLLFPEFVDDPVSPPVGAAVVFSASLLHEATAVTRGRRYVLLTFLHNHEAEAKRLAYLQRGA